jgi:hypothetical protein
MIQRVAALARSRNEDAQILLDALLSNQISQSARSQGHIQAIVRLWLGCDDTLCSFVVHERDYIVFVEI